MTTNKEIKCQPECDAEKLLKLLSGKWKPQIFRLAVEGPLRFSNLLRQIPGSNKQSLSVALNELVEELMLEKQIIKQKPLHIEYLLTEKGRSLLGVFRELEVLSDPDNKKASS
ncbi:winged helix-turn-helix transcriptional regulator [Chitinophaga pinensis]|uniref:Transcriptional regulator, HxlR family n=1 Tax=Chitinophaga pinensis (strain ATCC 43595 / DSM 2588 / LMG 13176 / NBRC 15968 / NCIMB 11800 / UQM 2034) TaxID=485918 RepID=A0A979GZK7_CHIPD|nr:helix-turn-helix domain-containing protein [Chitinophaga pinensis]ACU62645.1 transcriptional regulator, HxlR family [Chitinophaga pinensis DSM 2588]